MTMMDGHTPFVFADLITDWTFCHFFHLF